MASFEHPASVPTARPYGSALRADEIYWRGVCEERSHIAGELHDGLFCHLHAAALRLQNASETLLSESTLSQTVSDGLCADLRAAEGLLQRAVAETRSWLRDQPPASCASESLDGALRRIAREAPTVGGSACLVQVILDETLPLLATRTRWELVRISQEALRNAVRHGCARAVEVRLDHLAPKALVRLCVKDDGCGFDPSAPRQADGAVHFGLQAMRSRAERLGGWFTVASQPGEGTSVTAAVPVTLLPIRPGAAYWPVIHHPALDH